MGCEMKRSRRLRAWRFGLLTSLAICTSQAFAGWKIETQIDRMTDKPTKWARLEAKATDRGITAELQLMCLADKLVGGHKLYVRLSERMTPGEMGIDWRIDDGTTEPMFARVTTDLQSLDLPRVVNAIAGARRLRLQIQPTGGPVIFFEFDLTGSTKAMRDIPCERGSAF
jgi:hypothetical protein